MAKTVVVTIAGRPYRVACEEGEERRLQDLGRHVDQTVGRLRKEFGEIGDNRLVIMTAITIADELFEARRRIGELERQMTADVAARSAAELDRDSLVEELVMSLDGAADRVERIARSLRDPGEAGRRLAT